MNRSALTSIELIAVMSLLTALSALSVPGVLGVVARGRASAGAEAIVEVANGARRLALQSQADGACYGVVVVQPDDGSPAWAALTCGTTASQATIVGTDGSVPAAPGQERLKRVLPASVKISEPGPGSLGWMYQHRTGYPVVTTAPGAQPQAIGTGVGPIPTLTVQLARGRAARSVAVYEIGIARVAER